MSKIRKRSVVLCPECLLHNGDWKFDVDFLRDEKVGDDCLRCEVCQEYFPTN